MAEIDDVATWLVANSDKKDSPEYGEKLARLRELYTTKPATQAADPNTWSGIVASGKPDEQVRASIEELPPGERRNKAYTGWADAVVEKEGTGPGDYVRSFARGVPGFGGWADELNALTYQAGNALGLTDKTPEEVLAYNRARDRYFGRTNPVGDVSSQLAGGMATPYLRGAGVGRNAIYNTALGAIQGAGEGEGGPADRINPALTNAAVSGGASLLFGPTGAYFDRYHRGNVDPAIEAAANRLNVNAPYFVRARDPLAQAEGRRTAQTRIGSAPNVGFENMQTQYGNAAEGVVRRVTGAPSEVAPYVAGQTVQPAMERAATGAGQASGALAQQLNQAIPPGARMDPVATRQALQDIINQRAAVNPDTAERGLQDAMSLVTTPGGVSMEASNRFTTDVGKQLGVPNLSPRTAVTKDDLSRLYAAQQGTDRPAFVAAQTGDPALFGRITEQQRQLADLQRAIDAAVSGRSPEQLVNLVQQAASTSRGPTNISQLAMILQQMNPQEIQQLAGGVLGNIVNKAQVTGAAGPVTNPGAVAKGISSLTDAGRTGLFAPGTAMASDVDAMRVLGERIAAVDRFAGRGSAASLGERMAMPTMAGGSGLIGGLAHMLGMPSQVSWPAIAASVAALAAQGIKHATQPSFAQYGANPLLVESANRLGYSAGRAAGDYFTPQAK